MSSGTIDSPDLSGMLYQLPFLAGDLGERTAPLFADLADEHGIENVLVLKRFPTETTAIANQFATAVDTVEQPRVIGLSAHASQSLEEHEAPPRRLDQAEWNLLLSRHIDRYSWESSYLQRAAAHESFEFDVGRFVTEATWQGGDIDAGDPILAELDAANDAYHEWLAETDALDPAMILQYATDALADPEVRARIQESFDAVLALEFEEFTPIDREYLARLTDECKLVCVAESESAIQRTWNEPGQITDYAPELSCSTIEDEQPSTRPDAVASFLATGEVPEIPERGDIAVIEGETVADQILGVAQEIERLRRVEDVEYEEMMVVLRDSNAPIPETLRRLRTAGVPVASATVSGLEHDPAARELYALGSWCLAQKQGERDADDIGWTEQRARSVLESRVPGLSEELLHRVSERGREDDLAAGLDTWLVESDLKDRITRSGETLTVKTQFQHVRTVRSLATAIDRSELLDGTWTVFCDGLEQEMQRATSDKVATELTVPECGVLVDAVRVAKNAERKVVFLPGLVDEEYPAAPRFNGLFPTPHLQQLPEYPAFSTPDATDVCETFGFVDEAGARPLHEYYAALSRRMLAVGARAASERLYFGTYREDAASGQTYQTSRFLDAVEAAFGDLDRIEHDEIYTYGEAVRFALDGVENALEDVKRGGLVREPVVIGDVERDFAAMQEFLEADPPEDLPTAIEARVDFAEGVVRRE